MTEEELLAGIIREIVNPIIMILTAGAIAWFLWGLFQFVSNSDDPTAKIEGRKKIIWGLIGLTIMVSVGGILAIALGTIGGEAPSGI